MPIRSRPRTGGRARTPVTRDEVLRYIAEAEGEVTKRDLVRAFRVKGEERAEIKHILRDLQAEGLLERGKRRRVRPAGRLPTVMVLDVVAIDAEGDVFARPAPPAGDEPDPDAPEVVIPADSIGRGAPEPGDRVLARLIELEPGRYEGRVLKVLPKRPDRVLGVLEEAGRGLRLRPLERRMKAEFLVAAEDAGGAEPGDLVFAEVLPGRHLGLARAKVAERLGREDDPAAISMIAAFAHGLPIGFPPEAVAEAEGAAPVELGARTDLRDLPLVTIDGADARDFDDAVHARPDPDPKNPGGFEVTVAIADVAWYVRPGSALDREAERRGNSVYFPDRVIPMLPEALSNDLCSLRPDEDRACFAIRMVFDRDGNKLHHRVLRGLMRSRARLIYEQVQAAIDGDPDATTGELLEPVIRPLYAAFHALDRARERRGTIDLDLPEYQVLLDDARKPIGVTRRERLDAHRLIEEFMIAANVAAAETLEAKGVPCMYRVHDRPDPVKVEALGQFLQALGLPQRASGLRRPPDFRRLLQQLEDHELQPMVASFVLRSQAQAVYSPANIGHFGLHLPRYAHFTSPIRRYADLLVHRALIRALSLGEGGLADPVDHDLFHPLGAHISRTERRAMEAERQALNRFVSMLLADRVGSVFAGRVSGVQPFGLFVVLDENGADGLVPVSTLGEDFFQFDAHHHALVGSRDFETFGLGDAVEVELTEVDIATGDLVMRIVAHTAGPNARRAREAMRKGGRPKTPARKFRRRR